MNSVAIGSGVSSSQEMTVSAANTFGVGFSSTVPTLVVTPGSGSAGSYGNVGIGTNSPEENLDVEGAIIANTYLHRYYADKSGTSISIDWSDSNMQSITINNNTTVTFSGITGTGVYASDLTLMVYHNSTSAYTISFATSGSEIVRTNGPFGTQISVPGETVSGVFSANYIECKYDGGNAVYHCILDSDWTNLEVQ